MDNQYRFYSFEQINELKEILYYRDLGINLKMIHEYRKSINSNNKSEIHKKLLTEYYRITKLEFEKKQVLLLRIENEIKRTDSEDYKKDLYGGIVMEHEIVTKDAFKVIGVKYLSSDNSTNIPETWNKFNRRYKEIANRSITNYALGVCIPAKNGEFSYIAGFEVDNIEDLPDGMISEIIPAQKYVVFTHKGPIDNIGKTMENIYGSWLKQLALESVEGPDFELYDERFDPFNPDDSNNEVDIYIPIK